MTLMLALLSFQAILVILGWIAGDPFGADSDGWYVQADGIYEASYRYVPPGLLPPEFEQAMCMNIDASVYLVPYEEYHDTFIDCSKWDRP